MFDTTNSIFGQNDDLDISSEIFQPSFYGISDKLYVQLQNDCLIKLFCHEDK